MPALIDTHCHLNYRLFNSDLAEVLSRAKKNGVTRILIPGIDMQACIQAVQLCETHRGLYAAVGIHPNDASSWNQNTLTELRDLAMHPCVIAIGEIGLDYYRDRSPQLKQKEILLQQLSLAADLEKPILLHNRQAHHDLMPIINKWQENLVHMGSPLAMRPGVLHSYDGAIETALLAIEHHFSIGVGGMVTFKNAQKLQQVISSLPLDSLLTETDAPFLTPHPYRGQRNEPAYISFIIEKIANLHQTSVEITSDIINRNAKNLFAWGAVT